VATPSACEIHREWIESQVALGRNAMSIYQDLAEKFGRGCGVSVSICGRCDRGNTPPQDWTAPCFAGINTVRKVAPTGISPLEAREFLTGFPGLRCFGVACSLRVESLVALLDINTPRQRIFVLLAITQPERCGAWFCWAGSRRESRVAGKS
jgi:hypothetical protein